MSGVCDMCGDCGDISSMTRMKFARIALRLFALANIGLIVANWPRSSKLTGFATMIICGGTFLLAYREQPARFHRRVGRTEAIKIILAPLVLLGIFILLARINVL